MREGEGELLCLRQPMSKGCTTDYSPPRPPSIICSGLSVPGVCREFSIKASQENQRNNLGLLIITQLQWLFSVRNQPNI